MITLSTTQKRIFLGGCALFAISISTGYLLGKLANPTEELKTNSLSLEKEKTQLKSEVEKLKEQINEHTRTRTRETVTIEKDGTRVEKRVVIQDKQKDVERNLDKTKTEQSKETTKLVEVTKEYKKHETLPRFSLGVEVSKNIKDVITTLPKDNLDLRLQSGIRIIGPIWATGSYEIKSGQVGLGLRVDF